MNSTPPRLQRRRKEGKRGGVWTPHRLVFDATGRRNEAACGFHAVSSSMPQEGGETTRRRVGFTRPRWVLDSSLVPVVLLAPTSAMFPSSFTFSNYWLLSWLVSWQLSDWSMTWVRAMVGDGDVAPTSLNERRGSRWLGGSRRGGVTWWDLEKIQHTTWFITKQTYLVT